jgi:hypothetical protein
MLSVKYKSEWEIKLPFNKHDSMQISEEKLPSKKQRLSLHGRRKASLEQSVKVKYTKP